MCLCVFVSENAPRYRIHDIFDHYFCALYIAYAMLMLCNLGSTTQQQQNKKTYF